MMTVKECYALLNGNYEDAKSRLMNDKLIEKFMLKFPQDESMQQLQDALTTMDYELAFRSVHTLKGVAANLGFSALYESASALTEKLRAEKNAPDAELVEGVSKDYERTIEAIKAYQNGL